MPEPKARVVHEKDRSCWREGWHGIERGIVRVLCAGERQSESVAAEALGTMRQAEGENWLFADVSWVVAPRSIALVVHNNFSATSMYHVILQKSTVDRFELFPIIYFVCTCNTFNCYNDDR